MMKSSPRPKPNPGGMKSSPRPMAKPQKPSVPPNASSAFRTPMKSSPRPMPAGPARAQFMLDRQARSGDGYKSGGMVKGGGKGYKDGGCVMSGRGGKYKGMK